ncbi:MULTISPECIES: glycosyltransferase [unclassified Bacillus (in: firmicutes)]|uniref:glycosyltransferase n=1 Tax=unclassified Bacillus (in: firmicutes) TaxID=185979 RepID=UPI000BF05280|nr:MULTISPECIES: glycosyltransferase [unclassified Bacillus (in: firmicutes)]PEJ58321.1 glycosyltransferase [Bacillus sp. AFS002410]PEL08165.1 glycosyltransferase [Bacillus sp. AFS017336]
MKKQLLKLTTVFLCFALFLAPIKTGAEEVDTRVHGKCVSNSACKFQGDMRKLWNDHTIWTSKYIVSAVAGLPDKDIVLARLLRNQQDIGNAIKPYYGDAAGDQLAKLLTDHIVLAGKIVDAAKANDMTTLKTLNDQWFKNADDIAAFLSKANPNWSNQALKNLLYVHLKMVTNEVVTRIKMDWAGNVKAFDDGLHHINVLADALSAGIIKQFPNKFKN